MEIQGLNLPFSVSLCVFSVDLCVIINKELTQSSTEALGASRSGCTEFHRGSFVIILIVHLFSYIMRILKNTTE